MEQVIFSRNCNAYGSKAWPFWKKLSFYPLAGRIPYQSSTFGRKWNFMFNAPPEGLMTQNSSSSSPSVNLIHCKTVLEINTQFSLRFLSFYALITELNGGFDEWNQCFRSQTNVYYTYIFSNHIFWLDCNLEKGKNTELVTIISQPSLQSNFLIHQDPNKYYLLILPQFWTSVSYNVPHFLIIFLKKLSAPT